MSLQKRNPSRTSTRVDLAATSKASLPISGLAALAAWRSREGVKVQLVGDRVWVCWPTGDEVIPNALLPVAGVEFYRREAGHWYRSGSRLPSFDLPKEEPSVPLYQVLTPLPATWEEPWTNWNLVPLRLQRDGSPRAKSALLCQAKMLLDWAESAPTAVLARFRAAHCGDQVLLIGQALPAIPGGEPFWGNRVLVPLGYQTEPSLAESVLAEVLGASPQEWILFHLEGIELIPETVFRPLTRAGVRLLLAETKP